MQIGSASTAYNSCVDRRDWNNAARIAGETEHTIRIRHDQAYREQFGHDLTPQKTPPISVTMAARVRAIHKTTIGGHQVTDRYLAECVGCHPDTIAIIRRGYSTMKPDTMHRLSAVLDRLEAGEVIEPKTKPRLTDEQTAWADDIRTRIVKAMGTGAIGRFAKSVNLQKGSLYNITCKHSPASPRAKAAIEAQLEIIEKQRDAA